MNRYSSNLSPLGAFIDNQEEQRTSCNYVNNKKVNIVAYCLAKERLMIIMIIVY